MLTIQQQSVNPEQFNYELSLAFVVVVVTTGVSYHRGRHPGRDRLRDPPAAAHLRSRPLRGQQSHFVLFAFGALTYAAHPEGILEFQKRRWTMRFERLIFASFLHRRTGFPGREGRRGDGGSPGAHRRARGGRELRRRGHAGRRNRSVKRHLGPDHRGRPHGRACPVTARWFRWPG